MERSNWLQRVQLQKQWQTARLAELEKQVEELLAVKATQAATIEALRTRVRACPHLILSSVSLSH